ncbi:hypothetical protein LA6_002905 [Marinibacterium anthonyi]|nr:hypothetical protein LA6_002905 [Marinibacterium anthonyi]
MSDIITDPAVDAIFAKAPTWGAEMAELRRILLACPVKEELKWRQPCYTAHGGNIAIIGQYKDACVLSFLKGVLLDDPQALLDPPGEHSRSARVARFTDCDQIRAAEDVLKAYVLEAIENQKAGRTVAFPKDDLEYPEELTAHLDADDAFRAAFESLTPGRRRSWVLHVSQARQAKTRVSRIEKAMPKIFDGKGLTDR